VIVRSERTSELLEGRTVVPGPVIRRDRILIRTYLNSYTGYGIHAEHLGRAIEALGTPVGYAAINSDASFLPVSEFLTTRSISNPDDDREILLANPVHPIDPRRRTIAFTMNETTKLRPGAVGKLNRCAAVLVPSRWVADRFRDDSVSVPIHVAPHGVDHAVFRRTGDPSGEACTFGVSGRMVHGGVRKGIAEAIAAFRDAFPTERDVRLRVKVWPDDPLGDVPDDDRIEVIRHGLTTGQMADWYRSLDAFVSASCGEGFGLQGLEAMACGRAIVQTGWSGDSEYFDDGVGYRLDYVLEPGYGEYESCGLWARPTRESLIDRMREVYRDRATAAEKGRRGAEVAKGFTWERPARVAIEAYRELGREPARSRKQVGRPVVIFTAPDPTNVGDWQSNPAHYFDFLKDAEVHDPLIDPAEFRQQNETLPEGAVCIVGGGGLLDDATTRGNLRCIVERHAGRMTFVTWGCGANAEVRPWNPVDPVTPPPITYPDWVGRFDLHGIRDSGQEWPWVPCPSCMSPLFDELRDVEPEHHVVAYDHRSFPLPEMGLATLGNDCGDFARALRHLASGRNVLTSTYHGAYWSTLLGRRAVVVPFSSKFLGLRHVSVAGQPRPDGIPTPPPDYLEECRRLNREHAARVRALIAAPVPEPPLPPLTRQAASLARAVTRVVGAAVSGEPVRADERTVRRRLGICRGGEDVPRCDHYRPSDDRCGRMNGCGCFLPMKAALATEHCPIGKW